MSAIQALLVRCSQLGAELSSSAEGKLKVKAPAPLPNELREELKKRKAEILSLLQGHREQEGCTDLSVASTAARRHLPRPLGREGDPAVWDTWRPLLSWLREHHPEQLRVIWEAEKAVRALEEKGETQSEEYEHAVQALVNKFEAGRRLAMQVFVKVWTQ